MKGKLQPELKDYDTGNEILAKFMGMKQGHPNPNEKRWKNDWWESDTGEHDLAYGRRQPILKFHFDYNWLIPVIAKVKDDISTHYFNLINSLLYKKEVYDDLFFTVVEIVKTLNDNKLKEYTVRWEMSFEAKTHIDAAKMALEVQRDPDSIAKAFTVREEGDEPKYFFVDMYEENSYSIAKEEF